MAKQETFKVTILSPEEILFQGEVIAITCYNKEGEFDILSFHSNFISLIYKSIRIRPLEGPEQTIPIGYALLKSFSNEITILTNVDISSYTELITASTHNPATAEQK